MAFYKMRLAAAMVMCACCVSEPVIAIEHDYSKDVCLIKATFTQGDPKSLTGFCAADWNGIVTALHGVVGAKTITARFAGPGTKLHKLRIAFVDIEHDLALLNTSSPAKVGSDSGLSLSTTMANSGIVKSGQKVHIVGYPLGMDKQHWISALDVDGTPIQPLDTFGTRVRLFLRSRKSPAVEQPVLRVVGQIRPGHSGAPILNMETKEVIAVANGGVESNGGFGWGILLNGVSWVPVNSNDTRHELDKLAGMSNNSLFAVGRDSRMIRQIESQLSELEAINALIEAKIELIGEREQLLVVQKLREIEHKLSVFTSENPAVSTYTELQGGSVLISRLSPPLPRDVWQGIRNFSMSRLVERMGKSSMDERRQPALSDARGKLLQLLVSLKSEVYMARLRSCNFRNADLRESQLKSAQFLDVDFSRADFSGADLSNTSWKACLLPPPEAFSKANFASSNLELAYVPSKDWLTRAKNVDPPLLNLDLSGYRIVERETPHTVCVEVHELMKEKDGAILLDGYIHQGLFEGRRSYFEDEYEFAGPSNNRRFLIVPRNADYKIPTIDTVVLIDEIHEFSPAIKKRLAPSQAPAPVVSPHLIDNFE